MLKAKEQLKTLLVVGGVISGALLVGYGLYSWLGLWGLVGTAVGLGSLSFLILMSYAKHMSS